MNRDTKTKSEENKNKPSSQLEQIPKKVSKCKGHMGTGQKYDFTQNANKYKASPASYTIPTSVDICMFKKMGVNFRIGRKEQKHQSYRQLNKNPGIGKYEIDDHPPQIKYSIPQDKCERPYTYNPKTPGPNHYKQKIVQSNTKHPFKGNTVIQPPIERKFPYNGNRFTPLTQNQVRITYENIMSDL